MVRVTLGACVSALGAASQLVPFRNHAGEVRHVDSRRRGHHDEAAGGEAALAGHRVPLEGRVRGPGARRARAGAAVLGAWLLGVGCVASPPREAGPAFRFPEDTFAFANELVSDYVVGPNGRLHMVPREVPSEYRQNCVTMARAARLFYAHARFEPSQPRADAATYTALVEEVMSRDPRDKRPVSGPVVIPGYPNLYAFSRGEERLVKRVVDDRLGAYFQRGNWRMILPFTRGHQRNMAERFLEAMGRAEAPVVHVVRFPAVDINHTVIVYGAEETPEEILFAFYDPNYPGLPRRMRYDRARRTFEYPESDFFSGGPVRVYEVYDAPLY